MSSRRKQSRPKSFGVNSDEPGTEGAATFPETLNSTIEVNEANKENGETIKNISTETNEINEVDQKSRNSQEMAQTHQLQEEEEEERTLDEEESQERGEELRQAESLKRKRSSDEDEEEEDFDETGADLANLIDELDEEDEERDEFNMDNEELWTSMGAGSDSSPNSKRSASRKHLDEISDLNITSLIVNRSRDDSLSIDPSLLAFKCKVCHKGFKHRRSLNRHVKLHSGEKNFKCPHCTSAFARSDHLKAHLRTHNNSKPYKCSVCQCGYNTQAALKVHIAHHHSKSKFRCTLCDNLEFHSQLALEGHIYTKHSKDNMELSLDEDFKFEIMDVKREIGKTKTQEIKTEEGSEGEALTNGESLEEMLMNEEKLIESTIREQDDEEISKMDKPNEVGMVIEAYGEDDDENPLNIDPNDEEIIYDEQNSSQLKRTAQLSFNEIKTRSPNQRPSLPPPPLLSPAQHSRPGATVNPMPQITKVPNMPQRVAYSPNTYCEMCNARFSSVESYVAHMRNCHPSVPFQTHSPASSTTAAKMPYLTSILAKGSPKPSIGTAPNGGIIIPLVPPPQPGLHNGPLKAQSCNIPNCNCSLSTGHREIETDDYFVLKETHYSCAQCNMTFFKINDYMNHLKQEHCVEVFRCVLCKQMQLFDNLLLLKEHFFLVS